MWTSCVTEPSFRYVSHLYRSDWLAVVTPTTTTLPKHFITFILNQVPEKKPVGELASKYHQFTSECYRGCFFKLYFKIYILSDRLLKSGSQRAVHDGNIVQKHPQHRRNIKDKRQHLCLLSTTPTSEICSRSAATRRPDERLRTEMRAIGQKLRSSPSSEFNLMLRTDEGR